MLGIVLEILTDAALAALLGLKIYALADTLRRERGKKK